MLLGYNTNGFAHHRLPDTLRILSQIGYRSVAITLEREHLDPPNRDGVPRSVATLEPLLSTSPVRVTIETGSRFILDPERKHQPTLISGSPAGRSARIEFIKAAVELAAAVSADCVSLWSGAPDDEASERELFERLATGIREVLTRAERSGVRLGFEPEPGMFIDTMERYEALAAAVDHPLLGLTLDVGHVHCLGDGDLIEHVRRWRDRLFNVHLEDMRPGVHEHLMFGEGDMDFGRVFRALKDIDYRGPVHVELSRHSHDAVSIARRSYEFLRPYVLGSAR